MFNFTFFLVLKHAEDAETEQAKWHVLATQKVMIEKLFKQEILQKTVCFSIF